MNFGSIVTAIETVVEDSDPSLRIHETQASQLPKRKKKEFANDLLTEDRKTVCWSKRKTQLHLHNRGRGKT